MKCVEQYFFDVSSATFIVLGKIWICEKM